MLFCHIDYLDENFCVRKAGFVRVKGARIEAVSETPLASEEGEEVYDGRGRLLMPALVNAHAHAPMTLLRGWGENLNLQDWLNPVSYTQRLKKKGKGENDEKMDRMPADDGAVRRDDRLRRSGHHAGGELSLIHI